MSDSLDIDLDQASYRQTQIDDDFTMNFVRLKHSTHVQQNRPVPEGLSEGAKAFG